MKWIQCLDQNYRNILLSNSYACLLTTIFKSSLILKYDYRMTLTKPRGPILGASVDVAGTSPPTAFTNTE